MKHKHRMIKVFRSATVFLLLITLVLSGIPVTFATSDEPTVESITVEPIELIENYNGYLTTDWDSENYDSTPEYFKYSYSPIFTITLTDGSVIECDSYSFEYNGIEYDVDTSDDQSYKNQWGVGTHKATLYVFDTEVSFDITIVDSPVKSVTARPIELIENEDGYLDSDWNPETHEWDLEYFRYSYDPDVSIEFKDGTVIDTDYGYFEYNGKEVFIDTSDEQSYENQWGIGVHTGTASVLGFEATFDVTVIKTPVKQMKIDSIEIKQGTCGNFNNGYFEYKNFYLNGEITFIDGTSEKIEDGYFGYNENWYNISTSSDQSIDNQWGIGTHKAKATVLGYETEFEVSIVESPIKSISVEPVEIIEGTDMSKKWDGEQDYYVYDYSSKINYSITLSDGTVVKGNGTSLNYDEIYFSIYCNDDQSSKNSWGVGSHKVTAYIGGVSTVFEVKVVEIPVKSISVPDVNITEETNGYYSEDDDGLYFIYDLKPSVTVNLKDGTVIQSKAYSRSNKQYIEYKGEKFDIDFSDDQSEYNKWKVGTHKASAQVLGVATTYNVNINKTPYTKLEIIDVNPLKEVYGGSYCPLFKYRLTKNDGSTVDKYYNGSNSDLYIEQIGDWKVGTNNVFSVRYAGVSAEGMAEIVPASDFEYIEQDGGLYITRCMLDKESIEIPQEIDGKKVIGVISLHSPYAYNEKLKSITIPDSVVSLSSGFLNGVSSVEELNIGSGISSLNSDMFLYYSHLRKINISSDNKSYTSKDGVVYNKAMDTLVVYPANHGNDYTVPETVTNVDVLNSFPSVNITFSDKSKSYKTVDGVTYSADMKKVFRCNPDKEGSYTMPETVTEISDKAFKGCTSLTDVKISDKVTEITYAAFENCTSLASVSIPDSVKTISSYAFSRCESMKDVNMPSDLETIDYGAFYLSGLETVNIPDSTKSIGAYAFCLPYLKNLTLGKNLTTIGSGAFSGTSIESIVIPDNITDVGSSAFSGCEKLVSVKIGSGITEITASAFSRTALSSVVIPSNVKKIGVSAFSGCSNLNDLEIKGTSVEVESYAFSGCPLKNYTPGSNISRFGERSFSGSEIKSLKVSKTVTEIAYNAFGDCKQLSDIEIPDTVLKINCKAFDNTKWYNRQPDGLVYLDNIFLINKGNSVDKDIAIKKGTKTIADGALFAWGNDDTNLENVTLPDGLKRIGDVAFYGHAGLKEINIPDSVEQIGDYAFANCTSLTAINVSPNNKYYSSVNGVLFNKDKTELIFCPKQNTEIYTVPATVRKIKSFAFECSGVDKVVISNSNVELEEYAIGYSSSAQRPLASSVERNRLLNTAIACAKGSDAEKYAQDNSLYCENIEPSVVQSGDANGDGEINAKDRMTLTRYLAKWSGYENVDKSSADVNNDGEVNAKDRMILTRHLAKWSGYETLPYTK